MFGAAKRLEQRGFRSKLELELKFFFSVFSKLNQIKINKTGMKLQAYMTPQIFCNPWIQKELVETYMKMSKHKKQRASVFCTFYCKHSCMETERHKCYFNVFSSPIHWDHYYRKKFFFKVTWQMLSKLTKSVRNCQHPILWRNYQNRNLSFCNFLLKYEPRVKDTEPCDKEQKIYTNFFYFYVLKEVLPKLFS